MSAPPSPAGRPGLQALWSSPFLAAVAHLPVLALIAAITWRYAFPDPGIERQLFDFDAYYTASSLGLSGQVADAYQTNAFSSALREQHGVGGFLLWMYPPPFSLIVLPLGLLPQWLAYLSFMLATLLAFSGLTSALAGRANALVLVATLPTLLINARCGQNGFLTAALLAGTTLLLLRGSTWAGVPLGLMVTKPHLAPIMTLAVLLQKRWAVAAVAAATVAILFGLSTLAFGLPVWPAFIAATRRSAEFLQAGLFPPHRMVSLMAFTGPAGVPTAAAYAMQGALVLAALCLPWLACRHGLAARDVLGLAVAATPLVSPYLFDYDLPLIAVALALLSPTLERRASTGETLAIIGLCWGAVISPLATTLAGSGPARVIGNYVVTGPDLPSLAALFLAAWVLLLARIVWRDTASHEGPLQATDGTATAQVHRP